jgi:hypothetical protein
MGDYYEKIRDILSVFIWFKSARPCSDYWDAHWKIIGWLLPNLSVNYLQNDEILVNNGLLLLKADLVPFANIPVKKRITQTLRPVSKRAQDAGWDFALESEVVTVSPFNGAHSPIFPDLRFSHKYKYLQLNMLFAY